MEPAGLDMFFKSCHLLATQLDDKRPGTNWLIGAFEVIMKILMILTFALACILATHGQTSELAGEWVNVDPRTRGLTRLVISRSEKGWNISAWGNCHPRDCVWGSVVIAPVGSSVDDHSFYQGFAVWRAGFATKYVTLKLDNVHLQAEVITIFCDRSGRANFRSVDRFQRGEERPLGEEINGVWNSTTPGDSVLPRGPAFGKRMEQ